MSAASKRHRVDSVAAVFGCKDLLRMVFTYATSTELLSVFSLVSRAWKRHAESPESWANTVEFDVKFAPFGWRIPSHIMLNMPDTATEHDYLQAVEYGNPLRVFLTLVSTRLLHRGLFKDRVVALIAKSPVHPILSLPSSITSVETEYLGVYLMPIIQNLSDLKELKVLDLTWDLACLIQHTRLETLDIHSFEVVYERNTIEILPQTITSFHLDHLVARLPNLQHLTISQPSRALSVRSLLPLRSLTDLSVSHATIHEEQLLRELPLKWLYLRKCRFHVNLYSPRARYCVDPLPYIPTLRRLCTDRNIDELRAKFPHLVVERIQ